MPDQDPNINYIDLISRYLSGNATDAEVRQLEAWVLADPENKTQFIAFKKAWMLSGIEGKSETVNVDQLWTQTADQIFAPAQVKTLPRRHNRNQWLRIAAAIAVLVVASIWLFQNFSGEKMMVVNTTDQVKNFELPDGSQITLNRSSSLAYTPSKTDNRRRVELQGDAFFEVTRDENRPFIIQAGGLEIEVLGTSFYVDARDAQPEAQVIVQSGSVAVRSDSLEPVVLQPNDQAIYQKQAGELTIQSNEDPNYLSIKTKTLIFDDSALEEVVFALERQYNVTISTNIADPGKCGLNGTYPDYSLDDMLVFLQETWGIEVNLSGKTVILSGAACK